MQNLYVHTNDWVWIISTGKSSLTCFSATSIQLISATRVVKKWRVVKRPNIECVFSRQFFARLLACKGVEEWQKSERKKTLFKSQLPTCRRESYILWCSSCVFYEVKILNANNLDRLMNKAGRQWVWKSELINVCWNEMKKETVWCK